MDLVLVTPLDHVTKGMFVWRDFREDGNFMREKWKKRSFNGCLVGKGK